MERQVRNLHELSEEARSVVSGLEPREGATLITLAGELGAGKTAFTKAVAEALGVEEVVNSPTFVLEKIYALPAGAPFSRLVHIDAYRLESGADLAPLGFSDLMKDAGNLVLLEWPEKVADALPEPAHRISFTTLENDVRRISIT